VERPASQIEVEVGEAAAFTDASFVEVLGSELPRLQRIARLLADDAAAADDLVAEAIVRTLPKWRAGSVADPAAYLRRVLVNLAKRRWRRRVLSRRRDRYALEWLQPASDATADSAERDRTLRAVAALPPQRRAVVVLRFYDDLPEARIAEVLGIGVGTVKSTLSRAVEQLRETLGAQEEA
jgi:RNA polymerase sigma-70 factor (sigma-E family)